MNFVTDVRTLFSRYAGDGRINSTVVFRVTSEAPDALLGQAPPAVGALGAVLDPVGGATLRSAVGRRVRAPVLPDPLTRCLQHELVAAVGAVPVVIAPHDPGEHVVGQLRQYAIFPPNQFPALGLRSQA